MKRTPYNEQQDEKWIEIIIFVLCLIVLLGLIACLIILNTPLPEGALNSYNSNEQLDYINYINTQSKTSNWGFL